MGSEQKADARLIGQFGVGFYSAFVVADRVTVLTRRAGAAPDEGVKWESDGRGEYTLEPATLPERGTTVVLHLKEGEDEFLEIGRAHVWTPVTNAQLLCRPLLDKKK